MVQCKAFYCNPFRECCYILYQDDKAIVIDPGCYGEKECERIASFLSQNDLTLSHVLCTHAHLDHVFGTAYLFQNYGVLPSVHVNDVELFRSLPFQAEMFGIDLPDEPINESLLLHDHEHIAFGDLDVEVLPCPGHTPGGVAFYIPLQQQNPMLFSGDSLFQGSIGRTDLPGGNTTQLLQSIRNELFLLPAETEVYPGHGLSTTIAYETRHNAWLY